MKLSSRRLSRRSMRGVAGGVWVWWGLAVEAGSGCVWRGTVCFVKAITAVLAVRGSDW